MEILLSVRPKPGFGIGNRNHDQVSVSVSAPELFLLKPKLSSIALLFGLETENTLVQSNHFISCQLPDLFVKKCQVIYLFGIQSLERLGSDMASLI